MTKSNRSRSVALVLVALLAVLGAACTPPPGGTTDAPGGTSDAAARTLLRVDLGAAVHHVDLGADGRVAIVLVGDRTVQVDTSSGVVTDLGVAQVASVAGCEPTCDGATTTVPTPAAVSGDGSTTAWVAGTWLYVQSDR